MAIKNILNRFSTKPSSMSKKLDLRRQDLKNRELGIEDRLSQTYRQQRAISAATNVSSDPMTSVLKTKKSLNQLRIDRLIKEKSKYKT